MASAHYETKARLRDAWRALDGALWSEATEPEEQWSLVQWAAVGFLLASIVLCATLMIGAALWRPA